MNIRRIGGFICLALLSAASCVSAPAEEFTNAIRGFLQHRGEVEKRDDGIVVGIVDEHGSSIVSYGKLDNGTDQEVNGDTVFGTYSMTVTFTGLLLEDMIERGEMKLDDPVAKYLPKSVKVPTRNGKEITLRHLVEETPGLPTFADKLDPERAENPYADYTVEKMYAFLSDYQLTRDPGAKWVHGGVAMGLLGHVIALKAGTNYESLVEDWICRPLKMDSTRFTLTPELKSRLATEHNQAGYAIPSCSDFDWGVLMPLGGLYSTANDLLKYISAFGLTPSNLTPLMEKNLAHFPWASPERGIVHYSGGGSSGNSSYAGFDKTRRRGVVVLSTSDGPYNARATGRFLLDCEWRTAHRPIATRLDSRVYGSYVGLYQRSPNYTLGTFLIRQFFRTAPKPAVYIPAAFGLAVLLALLGCACGSRRRWILLCCVLVASGALTALTPLVWSRIFCARYQPRIGIRSEKDRLFVQTTATNLWPIVDWKLARPGMHPIDELLPPLPLELLPQSETRFFERLSGMPVTFSRKGQSEVSGLLVQDHGKLFAYDKISNVPPRVPEPPKRSVAIKLDPRLLDACVGQYEQAPCAAFPAGAKVTIRREGNQLFWRSSGRNAPKGEVEIYPESETNFFNKWGALMTFVKDDKGKVMALTFHDENWPDISAKKIAD